MIVTLKSEDSISERITIKPTIDKRVSVQQVEFGPIAPGMLKKVSVVVRSGSEEEEAKVKEDVQIVTKHDIYKVHIEAEILP